MVWLEPENVTKKRKLLAEAGYTADKPLTINLLYNTSDLHKKLAIAASSLWKKNIGVNVKLVNQSGKRSSTPVTVVLLMWPVQAGVLTTTNQLPS